jgi:hypothetical protein
MWRTLCPDVRSSFPGKGVVGDEDDVGTEPLSSSSNTAKRMLWENGSIFEFGRGCA